MRQPTLLLAAAPLALLAACGDKAEEAGSTAADDTAMATADTIPAATEDAPGPATALKEAGDYSGTYAYTGDDGSKRDITFNASDKTYSYTATDGTKKTGSYTWTPDGYRVLVNDYYGKPTYFAFRNGSFYELPANVALNADMVVQGNRYARAAGEESEVFSREPELGSPVVPETVKD